jgi:uncharacterized glyoxalase superfamily protein PhnB
MLDVEAIIPTFFVANVRQAADWYARVLGFETKFIIEEPGQAASYCGVGRGAVTIHLAQIENPDAVYKGACYLRLRGGVDACVAAIEAAGQRLTSPLKDHPDYGMREATVRDLDGNDIYLGEAMTEHVGSSLG